MYSLNNSRPRSNSQSYSPDSHSFRTPDFYLPPAVSRQPPVPDSDIQRVYPEDHAHHDLFTSESSSALYAPGPSRHGRPLYDGRDGNSPIMSFSQSYDRRNTSGADMAMDMQFSHQEEDRGRNINMLNSSMHQLKRHDVPSMLNTYGLEPSPSTYHSEPNSALTAPSEHSNDSESWLSNIPADSSSAKSRKTRREKPRIALAPDQPPTTQGKPRARVYVACLQCRTRKIRCDGAKPVCHNCSRRTTGDSECNYDPIPKRRGPDKMPGARQRLARDARNDAEGGTFPTRRRRRTRDSTGDKQSRRDRDSANSQSPQTHAINIGTPPIPVLLSQPTSGASSHPVGDFSPLPSYPRSSYSSECSCHGLLNCPNLIQNETISTNRNRSNSHSLSSLYPENYNLAAIAYPVNGSNGSYIAELDENDEERTEITSQPSLCFARKVWWDSLLTLYISPDTSHLLPLTSSQRETAAQTITSDLRFLFKASNYWFSFFHIPSFFGNFFDPSARERIQPSLILALLAMSTFWQSSEVGLGIRGRQRALRLRDEAQSALDASLNSGWIDETLAQAAWLLALFEVCAHPLHSKERSISSLVILDSLIRSLSLTHVDADDPNASLFPPRTVPAVAPRAQQRTVWFLDDSSLSSQNARSNSENGFPNCSSANSEPPGCSCNSLTLAEHWPSAKEHSPLWGATPAWVDDWSEGEIRKESIRRLCWSSIILAAGHICYASSSHAESLDLFISDPANYAILFSGESVARSPALSSPFTSKDTIWALHDRCFLLWVGCTRMRSDASASYADKAQFAVKAWLEADALEAHLNRHTCAIERAFIFQAREYIFNTRMCISYEFQRYIPLVTANINGLFHRKKAEEWLSHQATVAQRFMFGLHTITGNSNNLLARRPFFVFWFMGQISRALSLFQCDKTLTVSLDVAKALLPAIDYLTALWPCPEQRFRYEVLRERLVNACYEANVSPPPAPNLTLPAPLSPALV